MIKKVSIHLIVLFSILAVFSVVWAYPNIKKSAENIISTTPEPALVIGSGSSFYIPAENKKVTLFGKDTCNFDSMFGYSADDSCIILDKEKIELYVLSENEKNIKKEIWTVKKQKDQTILLDSNGNSISRLPTTL